MHRSLFRRRAALICALLGLPGLAAAQTQPWSSDWTRVEASALLFSYIGWGLAAPQGPIVGTPDGELILRTPSPGKFDDQIVRLDAQGAVRWCVNLGGLGSIEDDAELVPMLASTDGGAYVAVQGGLAVARIDGSGHVLWSSAAYPSRWRWTVPRSSCKAQRTWRPSIRRRDACYGNASYRLFPAWAGVPVA